MTISKSKSGTCPICQKPENPDFAPFCSKACKTVDLLHWFKEDYRVPGEEPIDVESDENPEVPSEK